MRRLLDLPVWLRLVGAVLMVVALTLTGVLTWTAREQRRLAIEQAGSSARAVTAVVRSGLAAAMMTGEIDQKNAYLDDLKKTSNVESLVLLRGEAVARQFGEARNEGMDEVDRQVLASGKPFFGTETADGKLRYRAVVPVVADHAVGDKNCQSCHEADRGAVLGAVKLRISLEEMTRAIGAFQRTAVLVSIALVIPVLLGAYVLMTRTVSQPLEGMAEEFGRVADGDLTRRFAVRSRDEIGRFAGRLNGFVETLQGVIGHTRTAASDVSSASQQLSGAAEQLASSVQEEAAALQQTAASLGELTATVNQNAGTAREVTLLARASTETAERGEAVVAEAVTAMAEITGAASKIGDITGTIDAIAFQTNLLALNAAVEAARAGDQGRGFAVVASEVRNLAQRAGAAAKEIKALIDDSVQKVDAGARLVNRSGETFTEIRRSVHHVTELITQIAGASDEQAIGLQQVSRAVSEMDRTVQSTAAQTEELSATAQSMAGQAEELEATVEQFNVGEERRTAPAPAAIQRVAGPPPRVSGVPQPRAKLVAAV